MAGADNPKSPRAFNFWKVAVQAKMLAEQEFAAPEMQIPQQLIDLTYDQWRDIRFESGHSLWRTERLPFEVQFFHLGALYRIPVIIHEVDEGKVSNVPFASSLFNYGRNDIEGEVPGSLGFAGFRIHYPINRPDYKDEIAVFLGASYFRAIGQGQQYGISARGLAIDTGLDSGEEFPFFREFWLMKPAPQATQMVLYALLDSPNFTGAYKFTVQPGKETMVEVEMWLFERQPVKKLGIAPLASMFFYGENSNHRPIDDFRPEVHDSDGLLIRLASGEWIWRPLINPEVLTFSTFKASGVAGFGLLQRDLDFDHYQDLEANYHRRPSVWVTPRGEWGPGHVELIQIPTGNEFNDNIVAFWVPEKRPQSGPLKFSYGMSWQLPGDSPHGGGYVASTRTAFDEEKNVRTILIDFKGGRLDQPDQAVHPAGVVTLDEKVRLVEQHILRNPATGGWRLVFKLISNNENPLGKVLTAKSPPINLRAFLKTEEHVLTETWDYAVRP